MRRRDLLAGGLAAGAAMTGAPLRAVDRLVPGRTPPIYAHRGASALRPEHTLGSYAKAIADGADFIEPDLVMTRDGVLVVRHENNIAETTDIAAHPEFAARKTEKSIDGEKQVGWFTEDFTYAELKTLRARERLPQLRPGSAAMDGWFDLLRFEEVIDFAAAESAARGRLVGIVPEIKHSTYFTGIGLAPEGRFVDIIGRHHHSRTAPLVVQSFETANLRALRRMLGRPANLQLMQLVTSEPAGLRPADIVKAGGSLTYQAMMAPAGLAEIARYADILAPNTRAIIPLGPDKRLAAPTSLVADAHRAGLLVQPWTFRPENYFLAADFQSAGGPAVRNEAGSVAEIRRYLAAGIDGFFTDDPALGVRARAS
ncbi:glycerophosphodiester phosphodiesterase [Sphingomonas morindae]|uniref:glycerophosphodiester phosphodiesterase n=1 Tax=Sphingomonas morindae TaxID=1541170 RepID=A0ABY4XBN7_9SPHN|nr:glycerophosphodiester phosphodiesterase [Sphingomonas morindae]USI74126.1 glycerophosphodiester phosphodiesterase [Sphingomonas morindae]